jgi:hypothetical protein
MKKKKKLKKNPKFFKLTKLHVILFLVAVLVGVYYYVTAVSDVKGFSNFEIQTLTPADQIARQSPLSFGVFISGNTSESEETGVRYDGRKLRLDRIEPGLAGEVIREDRPDEGNNKVVILRTNTAAISAERRLFATLHFTLIDQTDEENAEGMGFTEICTLFDPGDNQNPVVTPTVGTSATRAPGTSVSSAVPTASATQPTVPPGESEDPVDPTALDTSLTCIPLKVNGLSSDKLDILVISSGYAQDEFNLFLSHAARSLQELESTNMVQYRAQTLDKMNWYIYNHIKVEGRAITHDEALSIASSSATCPKDRYLILVKDDQMVGGISNLYYGGMVGSGAFLHPQYLVAAHEWGHFVGQLNDEYPGAPVITGRDIGNCSLQGSDMNPQGDPCSEIAQYSCVNENTEEYTKPCPMWDCSKITCTSEMRSLFQNAGCYPRCGSESAYRPRPHSVMDRSMFLQTHMTDTESYNGPSLYLIMNILNNYR